MDYDFKWTVWTISGGKFSRCVFSGTCAECGLWVETQLREGYSPVNFAVLPFVFSKAED